VARELPAPETPVAPETASPAASLSAKPTTASARNGNTQRQSTARTEAAQVIAKPAAPSSTPPSASRAPGSVVRDDSEALLASKAIELYNANDYAGALVILKQLQAFYVRAKDAGMISLIGFAALNAGENQLALDSFRQAAEWTDDEEFYLVLVDAHLKLGQTDEAQKILDGMPKSKERDQKIDALLGVRAAKIFESGQYSLAEKMLLESKAPLGAGNLELLGWIQLRLGKLNEAAANFEAAYRKKPTPGAAQGLAFTHQRLKSTDKLIVLADTLKGPLLDLTKDPAVREQIAAGNLSRISVDGQGQLMLGSAGSYTPPSPGVSVAIGPSYRQRNGTEGQGKLDVAGVSVLGEWVGDQDKVAVKVNQVTADNGETRQSGMNSLYALWRHQADGGLEYSLGLGVSPTGGVLSAKPLGEIGLASYNADYGWNAKLFRQANLESILSMSGSSQAGSTPGSRVAWGQVLEDGINLGGYVTLPGDLKDWKVEGSLTAARLTGEGVADNTKLAFWGRVLRPVEGWDGVRLGADMYTSSFNKNMSYYTPGFGGYFSPQASINLGGVAVYEGQLGAVKLNAQAGLGWGYVNQAAADGNPLTGAEPGKYAGYSSNGLATHVDIDAQLPLDRNWTLGLNLGGLSSPGYEEWRAWLYARYYFGTPSSSPTSTTAEVTAPKP
jgi:tetratricopeptide (TPR) repeat protein